MLFVPAWLLVCCDHEFVSFFKKKQGKLEHVAYALVCRVVHILACAAARGHRMSFLIFLYFIPLRQSILSPGATMTDRKPLLSSCLHSFGVRSVMASPGYMSAGYLNSDNYACPASALTH